jgi:predicted alpha/beta superfamily hydrolase
MRTKLLLLFIAALISLHLKTIAQAPRQSPIADSLHSAILQQQRTFNVVLPPDYNAATKYDVLYVLDGLWNTEETTQIMGFLRSSGFMPQVIAVGVHQLKRGKELTPTGSDNPSEFGGADQFLSFLEKELVPYISKKYPTSGSNALYGHSFGGLFVMYAMVMKPEIFDIYLAADPSFWWDKRYMRNFVKEKLDSSRLQNKVLFITGRGGNESEGMGIPSIDSVLRSSAPTALRWKVADYPGETHNSVKFKSVYDGLKFAYEGFDVRVAAHPMKGIVLKDKPYKFWVFNSSAVTMRYTTDGTEPGLASPLAVRETVLSGPAQVTIKTFPARKNHSKTARLEFKEGTALKTVGKPKSIKQGAWKYSYYDGAWDKMPDFSKLKPVETGLAGQGFSLNKIPKQTNFAVLVEGYLEITEEGYYIFALDSDDGSKFYLANQLLIDNDGLHATGNDKSFLVPLQKGFYPIRIEYFQREGGSGLNFVYVPPGEGNPQPVPIPVERRYY